MKDSILMRVSRFIVIISIVALFSGCTSIQTNYSPRSERISYPPLKTIQTASVGDVLLKQGQAYKHDAIHIDYPVDIGLFSAYTLTKGNYLKIGSDTRSDFYLPGRGSSVIKAALADPWKAIQAHRQSNKICIVSVYGATACADNASFRRITLESEGQDSFQQALIYSGKIGNKINFGYREFSNNSARPAFNNDVEYDLTDSKTIGYKGARIEIIEATNQYLKYKVISNFK